MKANNIRVLTLTSGVILIGLALYVIISGIIHKEDGNLLVNSILFLMILTGICLVVRAVKG